MSSAARAVRKQTVASVNMGTDAKTKNKGKKMKKGKQDMEERQEETIEQDIEVQETYEEERGSTAYQTVDGRAETIEVYELVTSQSTTGEDMRHMADIHDEFMHTMDPILRMYNAAMNVTETRMNIIKDEFKYRGLRCPIHHIDTRLKSMKSIVGKLEKKDLDLSLNVACNNIYDIAGVRVVCPYIKDVYLIRDRLMAQDDVHIMEIKDYIANPKKNGYRSLHMIIRVPVYFMNKKQFVPVEVQIRTEAMDMWASLEHDIKYKSLYQDIGVDFTGELLECSKLIYQAEEKMEYMNNVLEG